MSRACFVMHSSSQHPELTHLLPTHRRWDGWVVSTCFFRTVVLVARNTCRLLCVVIHRVQAKQRLKAWPRGCYGEGETASCVARECVRACRREGNTGKVGLHNAPLEMLKAPVLSHMHILEIPTDDRFPCFSLSSRDPACQLLPDMPLLHTLMKMRRYERTFHTWPTAGTRLSWGRDPNRLGRASCVDARHTVIIGT